MWGEPKRFAIALTCVDWRLHHPRARLYRQLCRAVDVDASFIDAVPGPDGLLKPGREAEWAATLRWTRLLAETRAPRALAVVAHHNCIAHPVSDGDHETDVRAVADALKRQAGFAVPMFAFVAIRHTDAKWSLKELARI
jgi:hypothetical protein